MGQNPLYKFSPLHFTAAVLLSLGPMFNLYHSPRMKDVEVEINKFADTEKIPILSWCTHRTMVHLAIMTVSIVAIVHYYVPLCKLVVYKIL